MDENDESECRPESPERPMYVRRTLPKNLTAQIIGSNSSLPLALSCHRLLEDRRAKIACISGHITLVNNNDAAHLRCNINGHRSIVSASVPLKQRWQKPDTI